jgi:hypothetical protein
MHSFMKLTHRDIGIIRPKTSDHDTGVKPIPLVILNYSMMTRLTNAQCGGKVPTGRLLF